MRCFIFGLFLVPARQQDLVKTVGVPPSRPVPSFSDSPASGCLSASNITAILIILPVCVCVCVWAGRLWCQLLLRPHQWMIKLQTQTQSQLFSFPTTFHQYFSSFRPVLKFLMPRQIKKKKISEITVHSKDTRLNANYSFLSWLTSV